MKVGLNLVHYGATASRDSLERWCSLAEERGYTFVTISDHVAPTPDVIGLYPDPFYECFTLVAWLGARFPGLTVETSVIVLPYRHPLLVARTAATLECLMGERFILGVGVGWAREEFEALGVRFNVRDGIGDEYLEVITRHWQRDRISYTDKHVSFWNVATAPNPTSSSPLPLWVGGSSNRALQRAARFGDGWHPINPQPGWLEEFALERVAALAFRVHSRHDIEQAFSLGFEDR